MTRLLTGTALGLLMGLTPALAQTGMPADETQTPPAMEQPATPSEAAPLNPGEPAQPIPDESAEAPSLPDASSVPPDASAEAPDSSSDVLNESAETSPDALPSLGDEVDTPDSSISEAPKSIMPEDQDALESEAAAIDAPKFLTKQEITDVLASDLIGQPVLNANNEAIGDVNDLVTDKDGKVVAVLIGAGGFLGLGEKDVAVSFDNLQFTRDENQNVKVITDMSAEMLSSAPDYERLDEQEVTVGAADEMTGEEETY